jgi:hypothetical protein
MQWVTISLLGFFCNLWSGAMAFEDMCRMLRIKSYETRGKNKSKETPSIDETVGELINAYEVLVGKMKGRDHLEKLRCGWEDNTEIRHNDIGHDN